MAKKVSYWALPAMIILLYFVTAFAMPIWVGAWLWLGIDLLYFGGLFLIIMICSIAGFYLTKATKNPNRKFALFILALFSFMCAVQCLIPLWFITQWFI